MYGRILGRGRSGLAIALGCAVAAGCSDDETGRQRLSIVSFTSSATTVSAGQSVRLDWFTTGATRVVIDVESGPTVVESLNGAGTVGTEPLVETTTFVLTAFGPGGDETSAQVTVTVEALSAPTVDTFTAEPDSVTLGDSVTLTWATTGAETVDIVTARGAPVVGAGAASGTVMVVPTSTESYNLTARAADGQIATAVVTVDVARPEAIAPTVNSFVADPDIIDFGDDSVLTWSLEGTTPMDITITDDEGNAVYAGTDLNTSRLVSPRQNTTYTLQASNRGGVERATAMVTVNPAEGARIVDFSASPTNIAPGDEATLSWSTENAARVVLEGDGRTIVDSTEATGSATVAPAMTTTYTLRAINIADVETTAAETVTVTPIVPMIDAFGASPNPVAANSTTTLSWSVSMAERVRVLRGATVLVDDAPTTGSTQATVPEGPISFRLEATNPGALTEQTIEVLGIGAPTIGAFTVSPAGVVGTGTVTVGWSVDSVSSLELTANGAAVPGFGGVSTTTVTSSQGQLDVLVDRPTVFALTARSLAAERVATATVTWQPGALAEVEPNDTSSTAQSLSPGPGAASGRIDLGTDEDWYSVAVVEGGSIFAETDDGSSGCAVDTALTLFATNGTTAIAANDDGGPGACSRIDPAATSGARDLARGTYFVRVSALTGATGPYVLTVQTSTPTCGNGLAETRAGEQCDDGARQAMDGCSATCGFEAEGTFSAPGSAMVFSDSIEPVGDLDVVRLTVTATAYIAAETFETASSTSCPSADTLLGLYDDAGVLLGEDDATGVSSCSVVDPATATWSRLDPGSYWLVVREDGDDEIVVNVDLVVEGRPVDVCGNGVVERPETCDDGGTTSGDGCSAACMIE